MNERFEELKRRAVAEADTSHIDFDNMSHPEIQMLGDIAVERKFAELIVRECIRIGQETSKDIFKMSKKEGDIFEYESHGAEQVVDNIKEHFGIE